MKFVDLGNIGIEKYIPRRDTRYNRKPSYGLQNMAIGLNLLPVVLDNPHKFVIPKKGGGTTIEWRIPVTFMHEVQRGQGKHNSWAIPTYTHLSQLLEGPFGKWMLMSYNYYDQSQWDSKDRPAPMEWFQTTKIKAKLEEEGEYAPLVWVKVYGPHSQEIIDLVGTDNERAATRYKWLQWDNSSQTVKYNTRYRFQALLDATYPQPFVMHEVQTGGYRTPVKRWAVFEPMGAKTESETLRYAKRCGYQLVISKVRGGTKAMAKKDWQHQFKKWLANSDRLPTGYIHSLGVAPNTGTNNSMLQYNTHMFDDSYIITLGNRDPSYSYTQHGRWAQPIGRHEITKFGRDGTFQSWKIDLGGGQYGLLNHTWNAVDGLHYTNTPQVA